LYIDIESVGVGRKKLKTLKEYHNFQDPLRF